MHKNQTITIKSIDEHYNEQYLYRDIDVQLYKKRVGSRFGGDNSEHSIVDVWYILLDWDKNKCKKGDLILYKDDFGQDKKLKIAGMQPIKFQHREKFIQLNCDLI